MGSQASAYINGKEVASNVNVGLGSGFAGFGTGLVSSSQQAEAPAATYVLAQFDKFSLSGAADLACATPAVGSQLAMAWCGEPNSANMQWEFDMKPATTGDSTAAMNGVLRLQGTELCASVGSGNKLAMATCSASDASQTFAFVNSTYQPWAEILSPSLALALQVSDNPGAPVTLGNSGSQFLINEAGTGHLSLYGPFPTDHCLAAACPVTAY